MGRMPALQALQRIELTERGSHYVPSVVQNTGNEYGMQMDGIEESRTVFLCSL